MCCPGVNGHPMQIRTGSRVETCTFRRTRTGMREVVPRNSRLYPERQAWGGYSLRIAMGQFPWDRLGKLCENRVAGKCRFEPYAPISPDLSRPLSLDQRMVAANRCEHERLGCSAADAGPGEDNSKSTRILRGYGTAGTQNVRNAPAADGWR